MGLSILCDRKTGYILYLIHIFSSLLYGYLIRKNAPQHITAISTEKQIIKNPFTLSVREAAVTSIIVGGYIVFFSVICELLLVFSPFKNDIITALLCGIFEISNGVIMLSITPASAPLKLALCSLVIGFSGLCITLQTLDIVSDLNISVKKYLKGKIAIALISFLITYIIFSIYSPALNVFNDCSVAIKSYAGYIFWASFIPSMIILFFSTRN